MGDSLVHTPGEVGDEEMLAEGRITVVEFRALAVALIHARLELADRQRREMRDRKQQQVNEEYEWDRFHR
jgi:hypothetical protein